MSRLPPPVLAFALLLGACASSAGDLPSVRTERVRTVIDTGAPNTSPFMVETVAETNIASDAAPGAPAALWPALVQVYADLGLEPNGADSRNYVLQVKDQRVRRLDGKLLSTFLDCGSGNNGQYANVYDVFVTLQTLLLPAEGGATTVRTQFEAYARDAHSNAPIRCTSRRTLEKRIVEGLREMAGRGE